jgi:hypothetical protein
VITSHWTGARGLQTFAGESCPKEMIGFARYSASSRDRVFSRRTAFQGGHLTLSFLEGGSAFLTNGFDQNFSYRETLVFRTVVASHECD